jgi:uncharacterized protein YegL
LYLVFSVQKKNESLKIIDAHMNEHIKDTADMGTAPKPLHFFFLLDRSGSMAGIKLAKLNEAMHVVIPEMKVAAENELGVQVYVRAITFDSHATWYIKEPIELENFDWQDVRNANGTTAMGEAFDLINDALNKLDLGKRNLPPVLLMVTDGIATDQVDPLLKKLLRNPWGKKGIKMAIGIGPDYDYNQLLQFVDGHEDRIVETKNIEELTQHVKWASTEAISISSKSAPILEEYDDDEEFMEEVALEAKPEKQGSGTNGEDDEEPF